MHASRDSESEHAQSTEQVMYVYCCNRSKEAINGCEKRKEMTTPRNIPGCPKSTGVILFARVLQANIKVQGSNGRNQMLKVWLPGLMQLVGDHAKAAVAKDAQISTLLDSQSGLRILVSED